MEEGKPMDLSYKKILYFIVILFNFNYPSHSIKFIDIDHFHFLEENRRGIRTIAFDTEKQKYDYIGYFDYSFQSGQGHINEEWVPWLRDERDQLIPFQISSRGNICIQQPTEYIINQYYIRTCGLIVDMQCGRQGDSTRFLGKTVLTSVIQPKNGDELFLFLTNFNSDVSFPPFICFSGFSGTQRVFSEIVAGSEEASRRTRAAFGELATEMTMLSFGYHGISSKNASDQGFDGVWIDSMTIPKFLFLSESKCQNQKKSAEAYMKDELSDEEVSRKLLERTPEQTKRVIEWFINEQPNQLYKLVHRLKKNGQMQNCLKRFDPYSYQLATVFKNLSGSSSLPEKSQIIQIIASQMKLSPQDMIMLILTSAKIDWQSRSTSTAMSQHPLVLSTVVYTSPQASTVDTSLSPALAALSLSPQAATINHPPIAITPSAYSTSLPSPVIETPDQVFRGFSYAKVIKLVQLINNDRAQLGHKKVSLDRIGLFSGYDSNSNIKKILRGDASVHTAELVWLKLVSNLDQICSDCGILKDALTKAMI